MPKPAEPHHGMQTVVFTCQKGDTFRAHGHADHGAHGHEVRRLRGLVKRGCPVIKLVAGSAKKVRCGAKVTEEATDHPVPARVEPQPLSVPLEAPEEPTATA